MSARRAILTIDDSPSIRTVDLIDHMSAAHIPAVLFCRGDRIDACGEDSLLYALDRGYVLGHHSYAHKPAGDLTFDQWRDDFDRMHERLQKLHDKAGQEWNRKLFRFPYIDRGDGDRIERRFAEMTKGVDLFESEFVMRIQDYIRHQGYTQDFGEVNHPLYQHSVVAEAADCLFTYSTCDWMLTQRHLGKQRHMSIDGLKTAMDTDIWLCEQGLDHIMLIHDEDEIHDVAVALIDHMQATGFEFVKRF